MVLLFVRVAHLHRPNCLNCADENLPAEGLANIGRRRAILNSEKQCTQCTLFGCSHGQTLSGCSRKPWRGRLVLVPSGRNDRRERCRDQTKAARKSNRVVPIGRKIGRKSGHSETRTSSSME